MKLTDLGAHFIRRGDEGPDGGHPIESTATLADAHAVRFKCPKCSGTEIPHDILIGFEGRGLTELSGFGPLWEASGTSLSDLTLSPSIHLLHGYPCNWHGFVRNGVTVDA